MGGVCGHLSASPESLPPSHSFVVVFGQFCSRFPCLLFLCVHPSSEMCISIVTDLGQ